MCPNMNELNELNRFIGARLKAMRVKRGYTQDYVADRMNISRQQVQNYEQGKVSNVDVLRLCDFGEVLGVDKAAMLKEIGEQAKKLDSAQARIGMELIKDRPIKVMVVEDTEAEEFVIIKALQAADVEAEISVARDGVQAQQLLGQSVAQGNKPDLILMDLNIPKISGNELLKQFRNHSVYCSIPVVVLTNSQNPQEMEMAYRNGACGYIIKSFDLDEFSSHIQTIMRYWYINILPV